MWSFLFLVLYLVKTHKVIEKLIEEKTKKTIELNIKRVLIPIKKVIETIQW